MALHAKYQIRYFHIGCDEVFHLGDCNLCQTKSKDELLLGHMAHIASKLLNQTKLLLEEKSAIAWPQNRESMSSIPEPVWNRPLILSFSLDYVRNDLKVIPLVWDDMMRHFSSEQMKRFAQGTWSRFSALVYTSELFSSGFVTQSGLFEMRSNVSKRGTPGN